MIKLTGRLVVGVAVVVIATVLFVKIFPTSKPGIKNDAREQVAAIKTAVSVDEESKKDLITGLQKMIPELEKTKEEFIKILKTIDLLQAKVQEKVNEGDNAAQDNAEKDSSTAKENNKGDGNILTAGLKGTIAADGKGLSEPGIKDNTEKHKNDATVASDKQEVDNSCCPDEKAPPPEMHAENENKGEEVDAHEQNDDYDYLEDTRSPAERIAGVMDKLKKTRDILQGRSGT